MKFFVRGTDRFYKQLDEFDKKFRQIIENKLLLLKENPYRFKSLHGYNLNLFRIRFTIQNKETRLIYAVIKPDVVLLCFIERKKDYKDLNKYIGAIEKQYSKNLIS